MYKVTPTIATYSKAVTASDVVFMHLGLIFNVAVFCPIKVSKMAGRLHIAHT